MFRHRAPRLKHRRRQRTMLLAVKVGRQTKPRGAAQQGFSLPRIGAERHHACRARGPPSTGRDESEKGAASQLKCKFKLQYSKSKKQEQELPRELRPPSFF